MKKGNRRKAPPAEMAAVDRTAQQAPEFSRLVRLSQFDGEALTCRIEAEVAERAALAERFDLLALERLSATLEIHPEGEGGLIRVDGRFEADLVQSCVVTLDPVPAHLDQAFTIFFTTEPGADSSWDEAEVAPEAEDPPEPVKGGAIDVGEAMVQQFALALDPYPRCPDASIEALGAEPQDMRPTEGGPFAELARLKRRAE